MKGFFFLFFFKAFTPPFLIVNFFFLIFFYFIFFNWWLKLKVTFYNYQSWPIFSFWKLKKRGSWNKFVYCIARCQGKSKNRKLLCSVIYFHSLVSWKLQKHGTAFTHERLFFQSVHTLSQMFLDGRPKTRDTLHCCC